ncbi:FixH family protein [Geomicrobium sediminis]|uniref:YtkA-like domain-containing protein n=1 Tax=Geomicrobium sediminis TaxID=1347788 RepID=A0ABS2P7I7_9BACL|nr:hypothetical protein [Geomicrobium sediminis]
MKRWMSLVFLLVVSGCGSNEETQELSLSTEPIDVEIQPISEAVVGEEITIETLVTQEDYPVEDAQAVEIEIRFEGQSEGALFPAENDGEGLYRSTHTFAEAGVYEIQSHVTARGMHVMPVQKLQVEE